MTAFRPCIDAPSLPPQYRVIHCEESDTVIRLHAQAQFIPEACPHCGARQPTKYGIRSQMLQDIPRRKKRLEILIKAHRLKCSNKATCGKIYSQPLPGMSAKHQMTARLYRWIGEQARARTFLDIARELDIAESTVRMVFSDCIDDIQKQVRINTPEVLALVPLPMATGRVAAINTRSRTLVGLIGSDTPTRVKAYLQGLHRPENVRAVSISFSRASLQAVQNALPNAVPFLDKPHVLDMAARAVVMVHSMLRRTGSATDRKALAGDQRILSLPSGAMTPEQLAKVQGWRTRFAVLDEAMRAAEELRAIHDHEKGAQTGRDAAARLDQLMASMSHACASFFEPMASALAEWSQPWAQYFDQPCARANGLEALDDVKLLAPALQRMGRTNSYAAVRALALLPPAPPMFSVSVPGMLIAGILK